MGDKTSRAAIVPGMTIGSGGEIPLISPDNSSTGRNYLSRLVRFPFSTFGTKQKNVNE